MDKKEAIYSSAVSQLHDMGVVPIPVPKREEGILWNIVAQSSYDEQQVVERFFEIIKGDDLPQTSERDGVQENELAAVQKKSQKLAKELDSMRRENALRAETDIYLAEAREKCDAHVAKVARQDKTIKDLEQERKSSFVTQRRVEGRLAAALAEIDKLRKQRTTTVVELRREDRSQELAAEKEHSQQLAEELASMRAEMHKAKLNAEELRQRPNAPQAEKDLAAAREKCDAYVAKVARRDKKIKNFEQERKNLFDAQHRVEGRLATALAEVDHLKQLQTTTVELREEVQSLRRQLQDKSVPRRILPADKDTMWDRDASEFAELQRRLRHKSELRDLLIGDATPLLSARLRGKADNRKYEYTAAVHKELMKVSQKDLVYRLTANPPRGESIVQAAMEYFANNPTSLAELLWSLNVDVTASYEVGRDDVINSFLRHEYFFPALWKVASQHEGPEVVSWVLERLAFSFPDTAKADGFGGLEDFLSSESDLSKFPEGLNVLARLKTQTTGKIHELVIWGTHANDDRNWRRVVLLPCEEELQHPLSDTRLQRLTYAHFTKNCMRDQEAYLERSFRLLREDYISCLREHYRNAFTEGGDRTRLITLTGGTASVSCEGTISVKGVIFLKNGHPLLEKKPLLDKNHMLYEKEKKRLQAKWLRESKHFFEHDSLAFVQHRHTGAVFTGQVSRARDYPNHPMHAWYIKGNSLTITIDLVDVTLPAGMSSDFQCTLFATRVQWRSVSLVLSSLQETNSVPFQKQLLQLHSESVNDPYGNFDELLEEVGEDRQLSDMQREAIANGLQQKVTLIQGPPGTGKTFVGTRIVQLLADAGEVVVIIAHTNHALDQLLCRVQDSAPLAKFLRLGAPSSTKVEQVKCMMHDLRCHASRAEYGRLKRAQHDAEEELRDCQVNQVMSSKLPQKYYPLRVPDDEFDRWGSTGRNKGFYWDLWKRGATNNDIKKSDNNPDRVKLFDIPKHERQGIINLVTQDFQRHKCELQLSLSRTKAKLDEARQRARADSVNEDEYTVIGCTTAYAAKNQMFIRQLASSHDTTLLVEEAAEILEPHVVTCLDTEFARVVMIGDHKQLPPKVESHDLQRRSKKGFDLNCSLFERLAEGGYPMCSLDIQHRMFPQLSKVVAGLSYPKLQDAPEIQKQTRTNIPGLRHQMFFFNHTFPEGTGSQHDNDSSSARNHGEAGMVVKTAWYLTHQNIRADKIVILTPYTGQVHCLHAALKMVKLGTTINERDEEELDADEEDGAAGKWGEGFQQSIRVSSIDNYQGEEADYVLVSLVRSNDKGIIGFLKDAPRLTVLLSRAKKGLIVFGNRDTLLKKGPVSWECVFDLWPHDAVDSCLHLRCDVHVEEELPVSTVTDFEKMSPEGGCHRACTIKMSCGHFCPRRCHHDDRKHVEETKRCPHVCELECSAGHLFSVKCHLWRAADETKKDSLCSHCIELKRIENERIKVLQQCEREAKQKKAADDKKAEELRLRVAEIAKRHEAVRADNERKRAMQKLELEKKHEADKLKLEKEHGPQELEAELAKLREEHDASLAKVEKKLQEAERKKKKEIEEADRKHRYQCKEAENDLKLRKLRMEYEVHRHAEMLKDHHKNLEKEREQKKAALEREAEKKKKYDETRAAAAAKEYADKMEAENDAHAAALQTHHTDEDLLSQRVQCNACGVGDDDGDSAEDRLVRRDAAFCGCEKNRHWMHRDCFEDMVVSQLNEPRQELKGEAGCMLCEQECKKPCVIPRRLIERFVDQETNTRYSKQRDAALVAQGQREGEELAKKQQESETVIDKLVKTLSDEMNNKCPRCKQVFHDYDNCSALVCCNTECKVGFCAFCFEDCGDDAHEHVANCEENPVRPEVYVSEEEYHSYHERRRRRLVQDRMQAHEQHRQEVWRRLFNEEYPL